VLYGYKQEWPDSNRIMGSVSYLILIILDKADLQDGDHLERVPKGDQD
jgi:hypothetical protein